MKMNLIEKHFDEIAGNYDFYKAKSKYYYGELKKLLRQHIPEDKKVFEIGCGTGDLLVSLKPKVGYGVDLSKEMIKIANNKYTDYKIITFSTLWPKDKYDYIFMSDVIEHLENSKETLNKISRMMDNNTVFIITMANPIWEPLLLIGERLGLKMPEGQHKRISYEEIKLMMKMAGLKIIKHNYELLMPVKIPFLTLFVNKYLEKHLKKYAFIEYFVAKLSKSNKSTY